MAGRADTLPNVVDFERNLDWSSATDCPGQGVFDGVVTALQLREGFGLHTLNATARQQFEVNSHRKPGVILHCFLDGIADAELAGKPMKLGRRPGEPVKLVLTSVDECQPFVRRSWPEDYVRKISIQMSHAWLDENGLTLPAQGRDLQRFEWLATDEDIRLLEALVRTPGFATPVERLQAEAMSLGLVAGSFASLSGQQQNCRLTAREQMQLRRIDALARHSGPLPSLQDLAREAGLSLSGLRRLIHTVHGCAPLAHVRRLRLEMARSRLEADQSSVEEAARLAGYSSAANFATAFRRHFGVAPSQVRRAPRAAR